MVGSPRKRKDFASAREWQTSPDRRWQQLERTDEMSEERRRGSRDDSPTARRLRRREWWAANNGKPRTRVSRWQQPGAAGGAAGDYDDPYGEVDSPTGGAIVEKLAEPDTAWDSLAEPGADARTDFFAPSTFAEAGASEPVVRALHSLGYETPSHVQALAYKRVLHGHDTLIADRTGSGKTLAYLAPLVQRVREQEEVRGVRGAPKQPLVVIIAPTAELAAQVLAAARGIARAGLPFRSAVITGDHPWRTQREALEGGLEVLVCTPGRFASHVEAGTLELTGVSTVVLDEVDVLLEDDDFAKPWEQLRASTASRASYIFVTATLPDVVETKLRASFPELKRVKGPGLHRAVPGVRHVLVECAGATAEAALEEKLGALSTALAQSGGTRTLVFCNSIEECRVVENHLGRRDRQRASYRVLPYHAALTPGHRRAHLEEFRDSRSPEHLVLVATDRASRGIDFACAQHVVLFSFPRRGDEWLRRVGRVGRGASGAGVVTSLVLPYQAMRARKMLHKTLGQEELWIG